MEPGGSYFRQEHCSGAYPDPEESGFPTLFFQTHLHLSPIYTTIVIGLSVEIGRFLLNPFMLMECCYSLMQFDAKIYAAVDRASLNNLRS
jgi:hypothetical protein